MIQAVYLCTFMYTRVCNHVYACETGFIWESRKIWQKAESDLLDPQAKPVMNV